MKKIVKKKKKMSKQEKALAITFVLLLILVVILSGIVIYMKNDIRNTKANIVIPILESETESELSVDVTQLKKGVDKEYIFKVSNYKNNNVNEEKIRYNIEIDKPDSVFVELYKDEEKNNLLVNDTLVITDNELPAKSKKEDVYRLVIKVNLTVENNEKITIKINS